MATVRTAVAVAYTATAARSSALTAGATYELSASSDCYIVWGGSSVTVTTTTGVFLAKGVPQIFGPLRDDSLYVSAIRDSADGKLTIGLLEGV